MKLIVGLGNPGDEYVDTRHNIGFVVVDKLAHELGRETATWENKAKHNAALAKVGEIILVKPQTLMNASGLAVKSLVDFYKLAPQDVWVIHDDLDLPVGKVRIRMGGASAGHHGVDSIIRELKSDQFLRIRLGIGLGKEGKVKTANKNFHRHAIIDFVLSRFTQSEAGSLRHMVKSGVTAVKTALFDGVDRAMNRFN
jgi:PTH1 family peptidyl-tRNA hydrolase